ncbi:MAG: tetratricopeptide repeat protein [Thermoanaerobaculia bacterium]|nr:tetratricopeptide repeat protein [Thermoanaerobaculia bacterium]
MSVLRPAVALLSLVLPFAAAAAVGAEATRSAAAYPFLLAGALLADGETEAALAAYAEAVSLAPDDPWVHLEYASVLARGGRFVEAAGQVRTARRLAPDDAEVLRTQARIAMNLADRDVAARGEAREAFELLLASEPDDLEGLIALGQLYLGAEEPQKAVAVLNRAAELRPGQPMIEALRSRALVAAGDPLAAESLQRSMLAAHPDRLETRLELAELLSGRGEHFEAAALLAAAPEGQQRSPELRRRRAVELYLSGDLAAAGDLARELHEELPDNSAVLVLLATIEQADGRWASVLELIGGAAGRNPLHDQLSFLEVRALERLGRVEEALAALARRRDALQAAGRPAEALLVEASAALLAARNDRAAVAADLARHVLASGSTADAEILLDVRLLLADIEFERGGLTPALAALGDGDGAALQAKRYELAFRSQDAEAAARFRKALAGGSLEQELALAAAEENLEQFPAALPLIDRALSADPTSSALLFRKATVLERTGRFDESVAIFEALIAAEPDHAPALNYLGYMRIERGTDVEKGLALVQRALQIDANNGAYVDSLGWGLYRLGRFAEASEVLERAARLLPSDSTVLEHLGDSLLALGARDRARDAYRRALALGPDGASGLTAKLAGLSGAS